MCLTEYLHDVSHYFAVINVTKRCLKKTENIFKSGRRCPYLSKTKCIEWGKKKFVTVVNEIKLFWRKLRKSRLPSQAETT